MKVNLYQAAEPGQPMEAWEIHRVDIELDDGQRFTLKVHDNLLEVVAANGFMLIQPRGSNLILLESVE